LVESWRLLQRSTADYRNGFLCRRIDMETIAHRDAATFATHWSETESYVPIRV
jgi:hypothetical protein